MVKRNTNIPALYWEPVENGVRCKLCPHECFLKEGKTGICKTRVNIENSLCTTAYGNLCSLSIDPIEKKPLFHFLPSSQTLSLAIEGCTFRCVNCQNYTISQTQPENNSKFHFLPEKIIEMAMKNNCASISYTYSEPVVFYEYMLETAKLAKQNGIKNVMVSNGYINPEPLFELCNYLDAANIDLKSFDNNVYKKLAGGSLEPIKNTLKILLEKGVWIEITNLVIPKWTDDKNSIKEMSEWLVANNFSNTPLHFSRFYPNYKLMDVSPTSYETLVEAQKITLSSGMKYVYLGNTRNENGENTVCHKCGEVLISREGFSIKKNKIRAGKCCNCGEEISGTWDFEYFKQL